MSINNTQIPGGFITRLSQKTTTLTFIILGYCRSELLRWDSPKFEMTINLSKILELSTIVSETHLNHILWDYLVEIQSTLLAQGYPIQLAVESDYRM